MDQNTGLNTMNLNAAIASLNTSGYSGFSSGQMTSMMSGLSNMANVNPMSMMGADQYNPGQPYHQQSYQPQQASYQPQYAQQSQLYQQQQPPPQQYQRAYQPALPMTSTMSSLESNTNGSNSDDRAPANDYREFKEKTLDVCREFMRGFCNRNEDRCKFAHPPPFVDVKDGKVIVCFDFTKNRCRRTQPPCRYMHPPPHLCPDFGNSGMSVGPRRSGPRTSDFAGNRDGYSRRGSDGPRSYDRGPMYNDRYDGYSGSRRGGNGFGDSQWGPPPSRGSTRRDDRRDRSRSGSTWGYPGRYGDGPRSDQIEVCREFMRSNCDRQECKYAHPPPHVKVDSGHVVYCIDHVVKGSCRKGDECRYFHMPRHLAIRYGKIDPRGMKRTYDEMRSEDREIDENSRSPRDEDRPQSRAGSEGEQGNTPTIDEPPVMSTEESAPVQDQMEDNKLDEQEEQVPTEPVEEVDNQPKTEQNFVDEAPLQPEIEQEKEEEAAEAVSAQFNEEAPVEEEKDSSCDIHEIKVEKQEEVELSNEVEEKEEKFLLEEFHEAKEMPILNSDDKQEDEAYIEGPPQKRIALDADFIEEQLK